MILGLSIILISVCFLRLTKPKKPKDKVSILIMAVGLIGILIDFVIEVFKK